MDAGPRHREKPPLWLSLGGVVLALVFAVAAALAVVSQNRQVRQTVAAELLAIARLKADQIAAWRREQVADAAVLAENAPFALAVESWMQSGDASARSAILAQLRSLQANHNYLDALLVGGEGQVLLALDSPIGASHAAARQGLAEAQRSRRPVLVDLHEGPGSRPPHTDVVAAITPTGSAAAIAGVVLQADVPHLLFPLIQSWPTPSTSAETLLVRREGDDVLFLNELRHRSGTALRLRLPVSQTDLPAARAAMGAEGVVSGRDYRGVPVEAAVLRVPGSDWYVVSKIDRAEVFVRWRRNLGLTIGLWLTVVGALAATAGWIWQADRRSHYQSLLEADRRRQLEEERYRITLMSVGDGVIATDARGFVDLMNPEAELLTGWEAGAARGRPLEEVFRIVLGSTRAGVAKPDRRVAGDKGAVVGPANSALLIARDGTERPIADCRAPIRDENGRLTGEVLVFRDQSEQRRNQAEIEGNQERLRGLVRILQHPALGEQEFLDLTLEEAIRLTGSRSGSIFRYSEEGQELVLSAWSGGAGDERRAAQGPARRSQESTAARSDAVRQRRPIINNKLPTEDTAGHTEGSDSLSRCIAMPVLSDDRIVAVVEVDNKDADYTDADVLHLTLLLESAWRVTERRRAEAGRVESESDYRQLFDAVSDAILLIDNESGRLLQANQAAAVMYGYSVDELMRMSNMDLSAEPEDTRRVTATTPVSVERVVTVPLRWHRRRDGTVFPVEITGRFFMRNGRPVHLAAIRDITERRRAAEQLEKLLARQQSLLAAIPDIVVEVDARRIYVWANPAAMEFFGADMLGREAAAYFVGEQDTYRLVEALFAGDENTVYVESLQRRRDGQPRLLAWWGRVLKGPGGEVIGAISTARDVTAQRKAEDERVKMEAQLGQSQKMEAIGRLAGGVAHDFNNMLTVILGLAERGLRQRDAAPSSIRDLQQIHAAAARSAELVSQLLAFSRRQTVSPQPVDIGERVLGMERLLRRIIEEDIDLRFEVARDLWRASIDPSQLDQIVANLAINSRDAMPQGGSLTVEAANTPIDAGYCQRNTDATPGEYVMLAVTDTGKGMDRETLEHAFEPFFTTKDEGRGTGLGLATVYGIVRQNGGFVNLYSEIGHGTVARIYLPRHVGEDTSRAVPIEGPAQGGTETILLVEDEEQLRLLVQTMLEPLGYTVLVAANPDQAIETCTRPGQVHLLLTDVVLPGMNGRELQDRVMMLQPGIRVLFMSGYTANVIAHRGVLDKGVHFLQKPFAAESLARKVRAVLDGVDPA